MAQSAHRAVQEGQAGVQNAEKHFAGALRSWKPRPRGDAVADQRGALEAVFPALDDLELVIAHERQTAGGDVPAGSVLRALVMVRQKLMDGLRAIGLEEIVVEPGVTVFDPALHQHTAADLPPEAIPGSGDARTWPAAPAGLQGPGVPGAASDREAVKYPSEIR